MAGLTYKGVAAWYGFTLDALSWEERRMTRSGLRRILLRIYYLTFVDLMADSEDWVVRWHANQWAYHEALGTWHRRLPSKLADKDRALVAAGIAKAGRRDDLMRLAEAWASKRLRRGS